MHPRNRYSKPHDFAALAKVVPALSAHLCKTPNGELTLDFTHPEAVRLLNKALLLRDYRLEFWDLADDNLCPAVPGRLDYIHVVADLIAKDSERSGKIRGLDIGTGASLIYPILGVREYGWQFVASEIDQRSMRAAKAIVSFNKGLEHQVEVRPQKNTQAIFRGVIKANETFTFTMCNPPFYESEQAARTAAELKWRKLGIKTDHTYNFGGQASELWTPGGEPAFLRQMIQESRAYADQVGWFTTLVSQAAHLKLADRAFAKKHTGRGAKGMPRRREVVEIKVGNKVSRVLAWGW